MPMRRFFLTFGLILLWVPSILAQEDEFVHLPVYGNCGMCQYRIESITLTVSGVDTAIWAPYSDTLIIWLNEGAKKDVVLIEVAKAVAGVGHDNLYYKSEKSVYKQMDECCLYERPKYDKYYCPEHPIEHAPKKGVCTSCAKPLRKRN